MGHTFFFVFFFYQKWNRILEFITNVFDVVALKLVVWVLLAFQRKCVEYALHYLLWHFSSSKRCSTGDFWKIVEISTTH